MGLFLADQFEQGELAEYVTAKAGAFADFSHRISPIGLEDSTLGMVDTVSMSINKAVAVVAMLSNHFASDNDEGRPSDDETYYALQAVQHELLDVGAVVEAYRHQQIRRQHHLNIGALDNT